MISVGIEAMNVFGGASFINIEELAKHRHIDPSKYEKLLIKEKTVVLPYEDPVSYGVNAAKPIIDSLSEEEKNKIELLITCTESGIDFGKSISTYIHKYLKLKNNCRLFEIKGACYSGTAGFQMAVNFILSQVSTNAKALVIISDVSRFMSVQNGENIDMDWNFFEPTSGAGSVAMLISNNPAIFKLDVGASGYYGYEVMDTCRPNVDGEAGDADLGLMSYIDCCEHAFLEYKKRVPEADYRNTFDYLAFHTPFGGMVKSAHRTVMRRIVKASPKEIKEDFERRVIPGIEYCQSVGNIMGSTLYTALAGIIDNVIIDMPKRIGCFSYGSGCCSEFFSGIITEQAHDLQKRFNMEKNLAQRYKLSMDEYEDTIRKNGLVRFGIRNIKLDLNSMSQVINSDNKEKRLFLKEIKEFHREYEWI